MATLLRDQNLVFIHIPKNGGTSVSHWLRENLGGEKGTKKHSGMMHLAEEWPDVVNPTTFAIIRNPWDRMISLYHFQGRKLQSKLDRNKGKGDFRIKYEKEMKYWNEGFESWLINCKDNGTYWFTYSYNQVVWMTPEPTYILRFETLENDFKIIQDITKCYEPLPITNSTEHKHYSEYYNAKTKDLVAELFKEDITRFNYEF